MRNIFILLIILLFTSGCLSDPDQGFTYNDTQDIAFYEDFASQDGVEVTDTGLLYRLNQEGDGNFPTTENWAFISYEGYSIDRSDEFDTGSDFDIILPDPTQFDFFRGLAEGISMMSPGANMEIVLPTELATRDGRVYYFDMTMDSFLETADVFLEANAIREDVNVTDSGLQYRVIQEGDGISPGEFSIANVNYTGTFTNGYVFDEGDDIDFEMNRTIQGFAEGLRLMNEGAIYELYLPPSIGYDNNPPQNSRIMPGAVLVFEVELIEVINQ